MSAVVLLGWPGPAAWAERRAVKTKIAALKEPVFCLYARSLHVLRQGHNDVFGRSFTCDLSDDKAVLRHGDTTYTVRSKGKVIEIPVEGGRKLQLRVARTDLPPQWVEAGAEGIRPYWTVWPAEVSVARFGREELSCYDLNVNGEYWEVGADGIVYPGSRYVLPFTGEVIVGSRRFRLERDREGIVATGVETMTGIDGDAAEVAAAIDWNRYRVRAGLPPAFLDKKLSEDCAWHCQYLRLHPNAADPHSETPGLVGYTPEGAAAGRKSCLWAVEDPRTFVRVCLTGLYHKEPLLRPSTRRIGVAARSGWSLLDGLRGQEGGGPQWRRPLCFPGHMQETALTTYEEERPDPIPPGSGAAGASVLLALGTSIKDASAAMWHKVGRRFREIEFHFSTPVQPAQRQIPNNSGCIALFPKKPLKRESTYKVRITYTDHADEKHVYEWIFMTE
ncbi:MAG: hypothetical protein O7D96_12540 [SAR324 cluster bacterium]|nr:hypothetical protein [SAR324 cluster bacterium]